MTDTSSIGLIGVGYWGKNLARNFAALGALRGVFDADAATREAQAALYPPAVAYEDVEAMLGDPDITAVAVATPAATHGALVAAALHAGKHVFVEKPLCLNVSEARSLEELARSKGRVLMVGHLLLYHPAFRALQRAVRSGVIGDLRYIYSNRLSLGKIRREENALWSFAPHDISMILALCGALPKQVAANGGYYLRKDVADTTLSHLKFASGVQAHVFVSWLHPFKEQKLVVVGTSGMAVFDDAQAGADKLMRYPHQIGWDGDLPVVNKAQSTPVPYEAGEPLRVECQAFLDAVAGKATPPSDAEEGIRVLAVLDACQRSLVSGGANVQPEL